MDYDEERYKAWRLPHPLLLHWIINPGLAFNELILGQRVPKLTLIEKAPGKALADRQIIPCPHCGAMNDARLYSAAPFGNYTGLACVECGSKIPSLKNAITWIVTIATWPLWKPFERRYGAGLLKRQHAKLQAAKTEGLPEKTPISALGMGAVFGLFMALFGVVAFTIGGGALSQALSVGVIAGLVGGVFFGVLMKLVLSWTRHRGASEPGSSSTS